jgi:hypothetical protein
MNIVHSDHPALARAARRGAALEEAWHDRAFLGIPEKICGIEAVPITLRILLRLFASRSRFFGPGQVRSGDIGVFLWAVSPKFRMPNEPNKRGYKLARKAFVESIVALDYFRARRAIDRYIFRHFLDRPPKSRSTKNTAAAVSLAAALINIFAKAYGWRRDDILDEPICCLYQYLTELRLENPKAMTFNPIIARLKRPILAKLKAEARQD